MLELQRKFPLSMNVKPDQSCLESYEQAAENSVNMNYSSNKRINQNPW